MIDIYIYIYIFIYIYIYICVYNKLYNKLKCLYKKLHIYDGYSNNVTGIGIQKESVFMYTCSEDGSVKTHDMRTNSLYNLD